MAEDELIERRTGGEFTNARDFDAWASKQKDPMARWRKLDTVDLPGDSPEDFPFLDVSDMPRFEDPPKTLLAGLESSIPRAGALLVEAVLLFYLGFVAFIRFDVR
jgi:hypothetical protein